MSLALLAALLAPGLWAHTPPGLDLLYPLEHPPQVSSVFGAYRLSHHHAGMDLTTGGDETVPVRAAAAGHIFRIKRSHNGYGRAVYVRHEGFVTVYGHLSAFSPKLRKYAKTFEEKTEGYRFDKRVKPIAVERGERLGWVGTAGTDLVHLHFEVRAPDPVNPLLNGLKIPDTQAPEIRRLLAYAQHPKAHVNGGHDEVFVEPDGRFTASGDVALLVEVVDKIDGGERALQPVWIELRVDGELRHRSEYSRLSYADKWHNELDLHPRLRAHGEGVFHRLYKTRGKLRVHRKSWRGLRSLKPGEHRLEVRAGDAAGNIAWARFTLTKAPAEADCAPKRKRLKGGTFAAPPADRLWRGGLLVLPLAACPTEVDARVDGKRVRPWPTRLAGSPALALRAKGGEVVVAHRQAGGIFRHRLRSVRLEDEAELELGPFALKVDPKSRWFDAPVELSERPNPGAPGLTAVSPLYTFSNTWVPAKGGTTLGLRLPPGTRRGGLALHMKDQDEWWRLGGAIVDGRVIGRTVHLASFAIMRDVTPPAIGEPRFEAHPAGSRLVIPFSDPGSGIAEWAVELDGAPVLVEMQRGMRRLLWIPWSPLKPGPHALQVTLTDRARLSATRKATLSAP